MSNNNNLLLREKMTGPRIIIIEIIIFDITFIICWKIAGGKVTSHVFARLIKGATKGGYVETEALKVSSKTYTTLLVVSSKIHVKH
jgi:hypothetical protein